MSEKFFVCDVATTKCANVPDQWGMCKLCKSRIPEKKLEKEAIECGEGIVEWAENTDEYTVAITYMQKGGRYRIYKAVCQGKTIYKQVEVKS